MAPTFGQAIVTTAALDVHGVNIVSDRPQKEVASSDLLFWYEQQSMEGDPVG
jgi:hypothetical protein